jgi:hypothetical protein
LPVGECADHAGAPPDLAQNALQRIVGADDAEQPKLCLRTTAKQ